MASPSVPRRPSAPAIRNRARPHSARTLPRAFPRALSARHPRRTTRHCTAQLTPLSHAHAKSTHCYRRSRYAPARTAPPRSPPALLHLTRSTPSKPTQAQQHRTALHSTLNPPTHTHHPTSHNPRFGGRVPALIGELWGATPRLASRRNKSTDIIRHERSLNYAPAFTQSNTCRKKTGCCAVAGRARTCTGDALEGARPR